MIKEAEKFVDANIMEGMVSIRAVLFGNNHNQNDRKINQILFAEEKKKSKVRELAFLSAQSKQHNFSITFCPMAQINEMTVGNSHGGIVAICSQRTISPLTQEAICPNGFYVTLEGIEDPYNFGYALRSIYAAGANGIVVSPRNWMSAAGVVARASAGASERFPMYVSGTADAIQIFRDVGYRIICADLDNSIPVYDCDLHKPVLLIVGGEKRGNSREVLKDADHIVRLDYGQAFPAALSAASAAGILAFEVYRQNRMK